MLRYTEQLYQELQQALGACVRQQAAEQQQIEQCFQSCITTWYRVTAALENYTFANTAEEVHFFKQLLPLFLSQLKYYRLRYYAVLFLPQEKEKQSRFWRREQEEVGQFKQKYPLFYHYYVRGETQMDHCYFTCKNNDLVKLLHFILLPEQGDQGPSYCGLVATFMALDQYQQYLRERLKQC